MFETAKFLSQSLFSIRTRLGIKSAKPFFILSRNDAFIYNTFAVEKEDGGYEVIMKLTCDRDVEDWEFEAIYDYYDTETLLPLVTSIKEEEDCFNPTWSITFDFIDNTEEMESKISEILAAHAKEIGSVYEAIADKRDEY